MARAAVPVLDAQSQAPYRVSLLEDSASLWPEVEPLLPIGARRATSPARSGLLGWAAATREEIAHLPEAARAPPPARWWRCSRELPGARGARTIAARLEGASTLADARPGAAADPRGGRRRPVRDPRARCARSSTGRRSRPRERQILAMVVIDFSNAEIARKLFVSESNVKNHLSSAFQKLGVKSRSAAAELILDGESGLGPGILRISAGGGPAGDRLRRPASVARAAAHRQQAPGGVQSEPESSATGS